MVYEFRIIAIYLTTSQMFIFYFSMIITLRIIKLFSTE